MMTYNCKAAHEGRDIYPKILMKAKEFDHKFDQGEDITNLLDLSKAHRPGHQQKRENMKTVNPSQADFERLVASIPEETPVMSLNLLRFRKRAAYPSGDDFEPCSGREAYQRYLDIVSVKVAAAGGQVQWMTDVLASLTVSEGEEWDAVVVVRYPSFKAFLWMMAAMPKDYDGPVHRTTALEDSRTILIRTPELQ